MVLTLGCGTDSGEGDTSLSGSSGPADASGPATTQGGSQTTTDDPSGTSEQTTVDPTGDTEETGEPGTDTGPIGDTCTDGVDCPCDRLADPADPLYDAELLFCEDFEDLALDDGGKGWSDLYGPTNNGCLINGPDWNTNGSIEGTCDTCCVNIVQPDACEASGEDDCVFHGGQSLGHRLQQGRTGGIVGNASFTQTRRFGVTYALKFSSNFMDPSPAMKTNEFGNGLHCILGCSTNNNFGRNVPFQSVILGTAMSAGGTASIGQAAPNDGFYNFSPNNADYEWRTTHGPGDWVCHQLHFDNWGLSDATIRYWIDGQQVVNVEQVDLTSLTQDADGIGSFAWNHYYNDGYVSSDVAYRYEDNFVITGGPEPVPCGAIGF